MAIKKVKICFFLSFVLLLDPGWNGMVKNQNNTDRYLENVYRVPKWQMSRLPYGSRKRYGNDT